ncbi:hypothetical protein MycrhDRAFT_0368 [Mycolicibacterium rhodesiae JS60]|nr:hypothetical protein MycrhDRAFT_0368 [Mycolicibacterium rhodesiae JS60]
MQATKGSFGPPGLPGAASLDGEQAATVPITAAPRAIVAPACSGRRIIVVSFSKAKPDRMHAA